MRKSTLKFLSPKVQNLFDFLNRFNQTTKSRQKYMPLNTIRNKSGVNAVRPIRPGTVHNIRGSFGEECEFWPLSKNATVSKDFHTYKYGTKIRVALTRLSLFGILKLSKNSTNSNFSTQSKTDIKLKQV